MDRIRYAATTLGSALVGLGGAVLTVVQLKLYREGIISGRGRIAVALVIFSRWRPLLGLFGALLFVAHPVQTQAVTYIVQRMASLTTLFYLLSVVLYAMARLRLSGAEQQLPSPDKAGACHPSRTALVACYAGSVLAAILAMKTKEIAFTLPLSIILFEICFFRGAWKKRLLYLLPLLATLPIIPLTVLGFLDVDVDENLATASRPGPSELLETGATVSRVDYLLTQFRVIVTYLRLVFLPVKQNLDYDYPVYSTFLSPPVYLSFLCLSAIIAFAVWLFFITRRTADSTGDRIHPGLRLIAFGILWFFLTLSVESSLIPIKDLVMEHRLYLPLFGAATAFAMAFFLLVERLSGLSARTPLLLGSAVLVLVLGVTSYQRNHIWGDPVRLWQDVVSKSPDKARPVNNLGSALETAGNRAEAMQAFARAIKIDPTYYKAYYNLADLYLVNGQPEKSLPLLQTAIRLKRDFTEAYVAAGAALMRSGRFDEVIRFLERYRDIVADNAEAHFYLGASYAFIGDRAAAERELRVLSRSDPQLAANLRSLLR